MKRADLEQLDPSPQLLAALDTTGQQLAAREEAAQIEQARAEHACRVVMEYRALCRHFALRHPGITPPTFDSFRAADAKFQKLAGEAAAKYRD